MRYVSSDISLSIILSRSIHVVANGKIGGFLWLSNIPLHMHPTSSSCIHSSIDGHLGCFLILAIVAMNIRVHISFELVFSYGVTYMWNLKNKLKQTHRHLEQNDGCQSEREWGRVKGEGR